MRWARMYKTLGLRYVNLSNFQCFYYSRINIQAAFKEGDSNFSKRFTKLPKKGLKNQEKANEILTKTKEDLKKLD